MEFAISRQTLFNPLRLLSGIVERKQTLPILGNILMVLEEDGALHLCTTDSELEMRCVVQTEDEQFTAGKTTVPALKLFDICRSLNDEAQLHFTLENNRVLLKSGRSRFTLGCLPADDFPAGEEMNPDTSFTLPQSLLRKRLSAVHFAMANQDVRYYLNGVLLEISPEEFVMVATDGHRLALSREDKPGLCEQGSQAIIPRKTVLELVRSLEDNDTEVEVALAPGHIRFTLPDFTLSSKLIDGNFPDYHGVIPAHAEQILTGETSLLKQVLGRVAILSNEKYKGVRFSLAPGRLGLNAHNSEQGEAEEEVDVAYQGDEFEIGFNFTYLLDALGAVETDEVELCFNDPNSSCLVRAKGDDSTRYVIMPMRL